MLADADSVCSQNSFSRYSTMLLDAACCFVLRMLCQGELRLQVEHNIMTDVLVQCHSRGANYPTSRRMDEAGMKTTVLHVHLLSFCSWHVRMRQYSNNQQTERLLPHIICPNPMCPQNSSTVG